MYKKWVPDSLLAAYPHSDCQSYFRNPDVIGTMFTLLIIVAANYVVLQW